ncbi:cell adhesion molecule DSCAM-like [Oscarella lobularis]|uniref:cell adhesion molecule DSCAM-like n=1 Tax=Oscarella lobularis TaxID=121494 RepID=UPI003313ADED
MQNSREVTCIIFSNYSLTGFSAASAFVQHLASMKLLLLLLGLLKALNVRAVTKVNLTSSMLTYEKNGLDAPSPPYDFAVDGQLELTYSFCAVSAASDPVWLAIDLHSLYSVSNVKLLSRSQYGRGAEIFVGKNVSSNGTNDYRCGSSVVISNPAQATLTDFACSTINWVQYVSVRRAGYVDWRGSQYLSVCEVEVYFNETEDDGVSITKNQKSIDSLNVTTSGDVVLCGSSKGNFRVTWKFPDETIVSDDANSLSIRQTTGSSGYKELLLSPLAVRPPSGNYICEYTANGKVERQTINLVVSGPPGKCSRASSASRQSDSFSFTIARCPLNHAPPVTKYQVFYRISSSGADWSVYNYNSASQPILVEGLTPFTNYDVRVAAGNEYGYGRQNNPVIISTVEGEPGPPRDTKGFLVGPGTVNVVWLPPLKLNGILNSYRIYFRNSTTESYVVVPPSTTSANLTGLSPYTVYSIGVVAVNVRSTDSVILLGNRSNEVIVRTEEEPPSAPLDLRSTRILLTSIEISWKEPRHPNGIIRNYTITYALSSGQGVPPIVFNVPPGTRKQRLDYLRQSVVYSVSVQGVTTSAGLPATILVNTSAYTPEPIEELKVLSRTFTSLLLAWKAPASPNGYIRGYRLYYRRQDNNEEGSTIESLSSSFNLTGLRSYTRYQIDVTVVNNAAVFPESRPVSVTDSTLITVPERPLTALNTTVELSVADGTASFVAPLVSDKNVPVDFVKVFVYSGFRPSPFLLVPSRAIEDSEHWRTAAFYNYEDYNRARLQFSIGRGGSTTDGNTTYVDTRLKEGTWYSAYFVAGVVANDGNVLQSSSGPTSFYFSANVHSGSNVDDSASSDSLPKGLTFVFIALFGITAVVLIIVVIVAVVTRKRQTAGYAVRHESVRRKSTASTAPMVEESDPLPAKMRISSAYHTVSDKNGAQIEDNSYVEINITHAAKSWKGKTAEEHYVAT